MHVSEYVCKTRLKELGILLRCKETLQAILAACNFSKNGVLPQIFFSKISGIYTVFQEQQFSNKNRKVLIMLTFMNSKKNFIT